MLKVENFNFKVLVLVITSTLVFVLTFSFKLGTLRNTSKVLVDIGTGINSS
jgi:prefoldin subunit 5